MSFDLSLSPLESPAAGALPPEAMGSHFGAAEDECFMLIPGFGVEGVKVRGEANRGRRRDNRNASNVGV